MASATEGDLHMRIACLEANDASERRTLAAETQRLQARLKEVQAAGAAHAREAVAVGEENRTLGSRAAQVEAEAAMLRDEVAELKRKGETETQAHAAQVQSLQDAIQQVRW